MKPKIRPPSAKLLAIQARLDATPLKPITAEQARAQVILHLAEARAQMMKKAR
jgi:hypothetical protein